MESAEMPKVEYSAAIEGIKLFQGKIKEIDGVICDLEKTIEKNAELVGRLNSNEMADMAEERGNQADLAKLIEEYQNRISAAKHSIADLKTCRETLMARIGMNIESEKSMQKVMNMPPQGRA